MPCKNKPVIRKHFLLSPLFGGLYEEYKIVCTDVSEYHDIDFTVGHRKRSCGATSTFRLDANRRTCRRGSWGLHTGLRHLPAFPTWFPSRVSPRFRPTWRKCKTLSEVCPIYHGLSYIPHLHCAFRRDSSIPLVRPEVWNCPVCKKPRFIIYINVLWRDLCDNA